MEFNKLKFPKMSNNYLIWILVAVVVLGFGNSSNVLGFNFFNVPNSKPGSHKHYSGGKGCAAPAVKTSILPVGTQGGFLGGNGLFLLIIVALLFLCKDDKKKEHRVSEIDVCEED